uniref:Putative secreted protein n=1 Tax=Anopheles marajoara TaxID=58244 RepID=A0A2M4C818_9DIPT
MVLLFLLFFAELQGNALDVYRLLPVDAPSLDRLRQELVDTIGWLMINARVPLLERSLELIRHLVLACILVQEQTAAAAAPATSGPRLTGCAATRASAAAGAAAGAGIG